MAKQKTVLIIDDEPDLVKLTSFRLTKAGYKVVAATDGKKGLESASRIKPDLIILDINLPEISGDEVCRALKNDEKLKCIPVMILSASIECLEDRVRDMGAQAFMLKPYDYQNLIAKVKELTLP